MKDLRRHFLLALALPLLAFAACRSSEPGQAQGQQQSQVAALPERGESVKPGINQDFISADLKVQQFIERFQGESREIAKNHAAIQAAIGIRPGQHMADIGAGTGLFLEGFANAVGPQGKLYAVDISPKFVEHLRQRAESEGFPQVETVLCSDDDCKLAPASVDLALICDTYHHFEYPARTMATIARAVKPGGTLCVVDFHRIPGVSREWLLNHVRAGQEVFRAEIEAAGFEFVEEVSGLGLQENYFLRFRRR
jgi:SAM-dependent methyltransferase